MKIKEVKQYRTKHPIQMIDIGVKDNHTFYVSDKESGPFFLTHNSMPDIDCVHFNSKILKVDPSSKNSKKPTCYGSLINELKVGDYVLDWNNQPKKVLAVKTRKPSFDDKIYVLFLLINDTFGSITANHKHRLILENNKQITVEEIDETHCLKSLQGSVEVLGKIRVENPNFDLCDITVEGSSTFQIIPFNVLQKDNGLYTANNYSMNENEYGINGNGYNKYKINCRRTAI